MKSIVILFLLSLACICSSTVHAQPEYRVKSITFEANTPAGFQAGKMFTATYELENTGNASGFDVQFFSYFQVDELGLQWDLVFDAQVIPEFPAAATASISYEIETQTSANYKFGGTINKGINIGNININIPSQTEQNTNNNTTTVIREVFCEGSILNLNNQVIVDERPIIGDEITAGSISILPGGQVNINGGNVVKLVSGFEAQEGANLRTRIGDCDGFAGGRIASTESSSTTPFTGTYGVVEIKNLTNEGLDLIAVDIFPNPTTDYVQVRTDASDKTIKTINVFDSNGKLVLQKDLSTTAVPTSDSNKLSFLGMPDGIYMMQIGFEDGTVLLRKIIKD